MILTDPGSDSNFLFLWQMNWNITMMVEDAAEEKQADGVNGRQLL